MPLDPEIQTQLDTMVVELRAKYAAERQAALDAAKVESDASIATVKAEADAAIAAAKKEGQGELLLTLKSAFGLPN
jgi:hypothetical protein